MLAVITTVLLLSNAAGVSAGVCTDGTVLLTESKGQLVSPAQGEHGKCAWKISVHEDLRIIFYFDSYNMAERSISGYPEPKCMDDESRIELKDSPTEPPWRMFCQSRMPEPIATNKSSLFVKLNLTKSDSKSWFVAEYETLQFEKQIDLRRTSSAEISSPKFPGKYPRNSYFKWSVVAPSGFRIKIEFTKFDILSGYRSNGPECPQDALTVRDGSSDQSELIGRLCGENLRHESLYSSGNSLALEFVSAVKADDRDNIGFKATVSKELKLYVIALPCALGILILTILVGGIVFMCRRRRSPSGTSNPRMQMSLLNEDDHLSSTQMSDAEPPSDANLPVYRPTTQAIKS